MSIINDVFKSIDRHGKKVTNERHATPINFSAKASIKVSKTLVLILCGSVIALGLMIWGITVLKSQIHQKNTSASISNTLPQKGGRTLSLEPPAKRIMISNSQIITPATTNKTQVQSSAEMKIRQQVINALENKKTNELLKLLAKNNEPKALYLSLVKQLLKNANWYLPEAKPELLKQALLFYPEETKLRLKLGQYYFSQKKFHLVIKTMLIHTPDVKEHTHYYKLLAATYVHLQQYKQALPLYRSLVELVPIEPSYLLGLGLCYQMLNHENQAREAYIQARKYAKPTWSSLGFIDMQLQKMQG